LLDDLVTYLPEGVYLTEFEQKGGDLTVKGVAESNARVSSFMRNLEASAWIGNPSLDVIETKAESGRRISNFTLHLKQIEKKPAGADHKATRKGKVS
jgi:type IV pilus assembly protein PilN